MADDPKGPFDNGVDDESAKENTLEAAWLPKNGNGGYYSPGKGYDLVKKLEVYDTHLDLVEEFHPDKPSTRQLAKAARVGQTFCWCSSLSVDRSR